MKRSFHVALLASACLPCQAIAQQPPAAKAATVRVTSFGYAIKRDVANVRLSLQDIDISPLNLTLSAFVKNAFDTAYPVFGSPGANAILSSPRTFGVELSAKF